MQNNIMGYRIEKWDEEQKNKYVVFLSHSSSDVRWKELHDYLISKDINCECDSDIDVGAQNFADCIHDMIVRREIFILYVEDEKSLTPWVLYELGVAMGLGKKIILCSYNQIEVGDNYFFKRFGPIFQSGDKLIDEIKNGFFFSDLLTHESNIITKAEYLKKCIGNIDICELIIDIPKINQINPNHFRFGYILLCTGLYQKNQQLQENDCRCRKNGVKLKEGNLCLAKEEVCSFCNKSIDVIDVVLNKLLYNCILTNTELHVKIPFNRESGVTFKMFVDVLNVDYIKDITNALADAGMYDISVSHSGAGNRIYFMLKKSPLNGVFEAKAPDGFINNYICKGAIL